MITLLVSSKSMVLKEVSFKLKPSKAMFDIESKQIHEALEKLSLDEIRKLMHISENLGLEVKNKIDNWQKDKAHPAWLLFSGDVYKGLVAESLDKSDFEWAQNKVWTLSGLYGIARPLDNIKPYRLEAGFKLKVGDKKCLYDFWEGKINKVINDEFVINLSSEEYIKLIRKNYKGKIITPLFLQDRKKDGKNEIKFEAVHAKVARGMMARWIIKNRVDDPSLLKNCNEDNYFVDAKRSSELEPVFIRKAEGVMKIKKD